MKLDIGQSMSIVIQSEFLVISDALPGIYTAADVPEKMLSNQETCFSSGIQLYISRTLNEVTIDIQ